MEINWIIFPKRTIDWKREDIEDHLIWIPAELPENSTQSPDKLKTVREDYNPFSDAYQNELDLEEKIEKPIIDTVIFRS